MNTQNTIAEIASNALATLAAALEAGNSVALTAYQNITARFHRYSWTNCLLIALQRPDSTHVAGFRAWLGFGRHVRKGEKGIAIFAPIISKRKTEVDGQQEEESSSAEPASRLVGFRSAYVFDVAQTDGDDLPEFATVKGDPAQHLERLKTLVGSHSITLDYDASIAPAKGVSRGGRITLVPNLPAAEEFSTLAGCFRITAPESSTYLAVGRLSGRLSHCGGCACDSFALALTRPRTARRSLHQLHGVLGRARFLARRE